jgi:hypothetical protein
MGKLFAFLSKDPRSLLLIPLLYGLVWGLSQAHRWWIMPKETSEKHVTARIMCDDFVGRPNGTFHGRVEVTCLDEKLYLQSGRIELVRGQNIAGTSYTVANGLLAFTDMQLNAAQSDKQDFTLLIPAGTSTGPAKLRFLASFTDGSVQSSEVAVEVACEIRTDLDLTVMVGHDPTAQRGFNHHVNVEISASRADGVHINTVTLRLLDGETVLNEQPQSIDRDLAFGEAPLDVPFDVPIPKDAQGNYMLSARVDFQTAAGEATITRQGPAWAVYIGN